MNTAVGHAHFIQQNKMVRMRTAIGQKSTTTAGETQIEINGKT